MHTKSHICHCGFWNGSWFSLCGKGSSFWGSSNYGEFFSKKVEELEGMWGLLNQPFTLTTMTMVVTLKGCNPLWETTAKTLKKHEEKNCAKPLWFWRSRYSRETQLLWHLHYWLSVLWICWSVPRCFLHRWCLFKTSRTPYSGWNKGETPSLEKKIMQKRSYK